ncbi:MAG: CsbD family protein [Phycisphaerae bacterium]|nr:CsbD family protein [Phycisphaerae bacterium]
MNWDQIAGDWKTFRGKVQEQWGKLTNDDLDVISGQRDQLVGRIQKTYGVEKEVAERQVREFCERCGV